MESRLPMRILVLTRSYPAPGDLYQYPFVHRRVLAYAAAGHEVSVFRPNSETRLTSHDFEGVTCFSGDGNALRECVARWTPEVVAAHGFSEEMWETLSHLDEIPPTRAWLHGSEIPGIFRGRALALPDPEQRAEMLEAVEARCRFWRSFLGQKPDQFRLVFVSRSAADLAREDLGRQLADNYAVISNPIDTALFQYCPKQPEDRFRVLMIRPFDCRMYGNDLAVSAILRLAQRRGFERLQLSILGDGPLFDETVAPLAGLNNVRVERRFLTQSEIAAQHRRHGIFLVPTRHDTQGVSRDEAMSSGLVPVTNRVSAVEEFVDDSSGALAPPDDSDGLAQALWDMIEDPQLFLARSAAAARRVRAQSGCELVIPAELQLLCEAAHG